MGDVLAVALGRGRYGLCHVVGTAPPKLPGRPDCWRVVTCAWAGAKHEIAAALRRPSSLRSFTGRGLGGPLNVRSLVEGTPPRALRKVGTVAPSAADRKLRPGGSVPWVWMKERIEDGLDPEAVRLRIERAAEASRLYREKALAAEKARKAAAPKNLVPPPPKHPTLLALGRAKHFVSWPERALAKSAGAVVSDLANELATKKPKTPVGVLTIVKRATRALNRLETKATSLSTTHAEDLHEVLMQVGIAAGVDAGSVEAAIDETRSW